jgi:hypothetical protein
LGGSRAWRLFPPVAAALLEVVGRWFLAEVLRFHFLWSGLLELVLVEWLRRCPGG